MRADRKIIHPSATVVLAALLATAVMYGRPRPQTPAATATIIRQVEVGGQAGATIVRVRGEGALAVHTEKLTGPDRLVLDFADAHFGQVQSAIDGVVVPPVRGIRTGQFKPDVARVVVDLQSLVPYHIETGVGSITVVFGPTNSSAAQVPPVQKPQAASAIEPPSPKVATLPGFKANTVRMTPAATALKTPPAIAAPSTPPPVAAASVSALGPVAASASLAPPVGPGSVAAEAVGGPPNVFENGLLTFHAKDQPLQSVLDAIGGIANVSIMVAPGVGSEHVSADFRGYRLDEALRQILKGYDVLFSYGSDSNTQGNPALRTVWVYTPNHGPGIGRFAMAAWNKSDRAYQQLLTTATNPDERARAVDELIRRDGRDAGNVVMEALKDPSDKVRYQALYRAVIVGAMPPEDTIIDLVLNDNSEQVRAWAFQTLPLDPTLQWVAQRAAIDSNQQIAELARNYLKDLNASSGTEASSGTDAPHAPQAPRPPIAMHGPSPTP
jgi:hypothetical protein